MKLTVKDVAQLIDISAVQTPHGKAEIDGIVEIAKKYRFKAVHVLPSWVPYLKTLLEKEEDILIGAPVGFPSGANKTDVKVLEARTLVADGVHEMDMMMNVGKMRSGEFDYVKDDIKRVIDAVHPVPVKVILEVHYLTEEQIKRACEICIEARADYVKTSTGWAKSGATLEIIRLITSFVGNSIKVKAAGGVRGVDTFRQMYKLGVSRFGINAQASINLLNAVKALPNGEIEID